MRFGTPRASSRVALLESLEGRRLFDAALAFEAYFPEGYASAVIDAAVPIQNNGDASAEFELWAKYERGGAETMVASGIVPGRGQIEALISESGGPGSNNVRKNEPFAYVLKSSSPLTAMLRHDDHGNDLIEHFTTQTATQWSFTDVRRASDSLDFILIYNPGTTAVEVTLSLHNDAGKVFTTTVSLGAQRRGGWAIRDLVGVADGVYGAEVSATGPIVAAQSQYRLNSPRPHGFSQLGTPGAGATAGFVPALELEDDFYSRRGSRRGTDIPSVVRADVAVSIYNGSETQDASVQLTFVFDDSDMAPVSRTVSVGAAKRTQFSMADLNLPVDSEFGVLYRSDVPVTVAASVFQGQSLVGVEAATQAATTWTFGQGSMDIRAFGRGLREDVYLFNPTGVEVNVSVDLIHPDGSIITLTKRVSSGELEDIDFRDVTTLATRQDQRPFSIQVRSSVPIVASYERRDPFQGVDFSILGKPSGTVVSFADALGLIPSGGGGGGGGGGGSTDDDGTPDQGSGDN